MLRALSFVICDRFTPSVYFQFVPFIVEFCVTLVERYGLNCVGLYRLSGSKVAHDFISAELRKVYGFLSYVPLWLIL